MAEELDGYQPLIDVAVAWERAGPDALNSGCWKPTTLERQIAGEIVRVTRVPSKTVPPHDDEPLWWRMTRISHWPAAFRLAALIGKWNLLAENRAPAGYENVDLQKLVSGLYPPLALIEHWSEIHESYAEGGLSEEDCDARLIELVPSCRSHIADAEVFIDLIEKPFTAVAKDLAI